ncbi:MAG: sigma-70 family RNA polymerase sigma factor [Gammaproteobacteria bacterium]
MRIACCATQPGNWRPSRFCISVTTAACTDFLRQSPRDVAEELLQDVWARAIRACRNYRPDATFRTWLYTLARNRLIDYWRRQAAGRVRKCGGRTGRCYRCRSGCCYPIPEDCISPATEPMEKHAGQQCLLSR